MKCYQDLFTYAYPIPEHEGTSYFIEHHDGSVSCSITWPGINYDGISDDTALELEFGKLHQLLARASNYNNLTIENHFFRGLYPEVLDKYLDYGERHIKHDRNPEFAKRVRREIAEHLRGYSRKNEIIMTFTLSNIFSFFGSKNQKKITKRKEELEKIVLELTAYLPGYRVLTADEYHSYITRCHNFPHYLANNRFDAINPRFHINHLINKPQWTQDKCIFTNGIYYKVITLFDYPDAKPDFFSMFSSEQNIEIHISQIIKPMDTNWVNNASANESNKSAEAASLTGGESVMGKIQDHFQFRDYVQSNNLTIHGSAYIIVLSSDNKDVLLQSHKNVCQRLSITSLYDTDNESIERQYWRVAFPGQGYLSPFLRPDHHWQVAHMAPVFVQDNHHIDEAQFVYLTRSGTIVGMNYEEDGVHHGICASKTGSGKSYNKGAQIAQLYPLGFNFYITEVGRSFEWIIKAFGGDYFVLDADTTVISPFPQYDVAKKIQAITDDQSVCERSPLPADLVGPTIGCILPILVDKSAYSEKEGAIHYKGAAEDVLQIMYWDEMQNPDKAGPTLDDFLEAGRAALKLNLIADVKVSYLEFMLDNLDSFLSMKEGAVFKKSDTIDFTKGLVGIDFDNLIKSGNQDLAKYLLIFIVTRFKQLAFLNPEQTFVTCDEYHDFVNIDPYLCKDMERALTRKGRKAAGYFDAISQEVKDIAHLPNSDDVDSALLNQLSHYWFMFYGTDHGDLPELFQLPKRAADKWRAYKDPKIENYHYRQCIYKNGDKWWDLHMTWPQIIDDLANSNKTILHKKQEIMKEGGDINTWLEKLQEFREHKSHA